MTLSGKPPTYIIGKPITWNGECDRSFGDQKLNFRLTGMTPVDWLLKMENWSLPLMKFLVMAWILKGVVSLETFMTLTNRAHFFPFKKWCPVGIGFALQVVIWKASARMIIGARLSYDCHSFCISPRHKWHSWVCSLTQMRHDRCDSNLTP